ncbi:YdcF family protein [Gracilibacillus saliphilus]|uniref:YdcF family protein n=1 Tax=Gracilibacillus saliphilus TaxID=543890 RepID=UPI0013D7E813|nr:YdcF family protein [Gracilibacillus saliphilus]
MKKIVIILIGLTFTFFVIHTIVITIDGLTDENDRSEVGVVLGNKVKEDGTPSARLQARLDKAYNLYINNLLETIIVSGGIGMEGFDEAEVMKGYLIEKGVPESSIITDNNGYNTEMTAENSLEIAQKHNLSTDHITVITQFFHISRTKLAMKQQGFEEVYGSHAEYFEWRDVYSTIREFPAFYKYLMF